MGKPKFKKLFPHKVYRCSCLEHVIASCLLNEIYSFMDICIKVNQSVKEKIFTMKCGENKQDVIFTCSGHVPLIILSVETSQSSDGQITYYFRDDTKTYCRTCVRICLRQMYHYFEHVKFPSSFNCLVKKKKK